MQMLIQLGVHFRLIISTHRNEQYISFLHTEMRSEIWILRVFFSLPEIVVFLLNLQVFVPSVIVNVWALLTKFLPLFFRIARCFFTLQGEWCWYPETTNVRADVLVKRCRNQEFCHQICNCARKEGHLQVNCHCMRGRSLCENHTRLGGA